LELSEQFSLKHIAIFIVLFDPEVTMIIPIFWFAVTAPLVPIEKILDEFMEFFSLSFKAL